MDKNTIPCPLCKASNIEIFFELKKVPSIYFYRCLSCQLVYKSADSHVAVENEKKRYELHNNDVSDHRYLNYLNQLWDCRPDGDFHYMLDYGSGPSKGFEALVTDQNVESFDPIFFPIELKSKHYDLVFCCEVVEHFNQPSHSWKQLVSTLSTGGVLLVRTETYQNKNFDSWYYKDDPTHVCFYNYKTLSWLAGNFGLQLLDCFNNNKFIFKKL